ncbi:LysR family transcriptional regulator [Variovorax defluvii]|uniref:LysR family transcriptional regulator n=1 Tax=Variovorax defluvii TaxID=913761 RepID=A0ABP8I8I5_9BURK
MYDLTQLKTFIAVVQEQHLTRASERLHISQPTASHHIRALEEHFGVPLFRRTARGLEVTSHGERIAEWAGNVVQASHELDQRARDLAGLPSGRLAIGTISHEQLMEPLSAAARAVRERFTLTELAIEAGNTWTIRQAIKSGELDAGVVVGTVRNDELKCYPLGTLDYVLTGPSAWRDRLEKARATQIASMPWIVTGRGTPSHELIEGLFTAEGLDVKVAVEVNNAALLRGLVAGEVGIGFMRHDEALAGVEDGRYCMLPRFRASLPLTFVHQQSRSSDTVLCAFVETLTARWAQACRTPA